MFLSRHCTSSLTCVMTHSCLHSWGRWKGGFGAEEDKRSGEDLHHDPRGHLQFWLHRSVSLLFGDGRFGKKYYHDAPCPPSHTYYSLSSQVLTKRYILLLAEIPSCHVFLVRPRRHLQSSTAAFCLHWAGEEQRDETDQWKGELLVYSKFRLIFTVLSIITVGFYHKNKTQVARF